ncbi:peptidoglycan editing factor PgeF [Halalkalibacter alkalisediminis]|uniref:Purine nucleoside phosphorylase n=1 Tax=Halalkalibacter alkalisediminis TaxID=935616 RepID=A0ABV6ND62_9BACI|nr:peptidoglycan editing factor PgeF [Halalkalibacter alkalisediminis]
MEPFVQETKRYLSIEQWIEHQPRLVAGFTTREGGKSQSPFNSLNMGFHVADNPKDVLENRFLLANDIQIPLSNWIGSEQVHESTVRKVEKSDAGRGSENLESAIAHTDGIYTLERNLLLTSLYADCVPLYFYAPSYGAVGLAHAGWRGTVQNIGASMVKLWHEIEGIPPEAIQVAIGPCISQTAYEVDQKVIEEIDRCWPKHLNDRPYKKQLNNKYLLDLREVNKEFVLQVGIKPDNVLVSSICTATDARMFSHRAEHGKTGRMMSFIGVRGGE